MQLIILIEHLLQLVPAEKFPLRGAGGDRLIQIPGGQGIVLSGKPEPDQILALQSIDSFPYLHEFLRG
jgi:hypothetical protein